MVRYVQTDKMLYGRTGNQLMEPAPRTSRRCTNSELFQGEARYVVIRTGKVLWGQTDKLLYVETYMVLYVQTDKVL